VMSLDSGGAQPGAPEGLPLPAAAGADPVLGLGDASPAASEDECPAGDLLLGDTPYTRAVWAWVLSLEGPLSFQAWKVRTAPIRDFGLEGTSSGRLWQRYESNLWTSLLSLSDGGEP